jgi:hypothetical protein
VTIDKWGMYLSLITLFHTPSFIKTRHKVFLAKALLKRKMFLMPQPPICFGLSKNSQLHKWKWFFPSYT